MGLNWSQQFKQEKAQFTGRSRGRKDGRNQSARKISVQIFRSLGDGKLEQIFENFAREW